MYDKVILGAMTHDYKRRGHPAVQEWLVKHPRFNMHFTPTSASWLNMVERFFRDLTTERLRRGVFTSVPELAPRSMITSLITTTIPSRSTGPRARATSCRRSFVPTAA